MSVVSILNDLLPSSSRPMNPPLGEPLAMLRTTTLLPPITRPQPAIRITSSDGRLALQR